MAIIRNLKKYLSHKKIEEKSATNAYDLWAASYDSQPHNLMLHLDEEVFSTLLKTISLKDKVVIDVGCGTGRHWNKIIEQQPSQLVGFDVSNGMLTELKKKFRDADVQLATDNKLSALDDEVVDVIISTLTIAHIENLGEAFQSWNRVLQPGGTILLTDYHPSVLAEGGKRDFKINGEHIIIKNFVHSLDNIKQEAAKNNFQILSVEQRFIDERVRRFYADQNALAIYEKFKGMPIIYGLHLKKNDA